jgi:two-component system cell cycle sensor histidine kinase/response regulator CckA
MDVHGSGLTKRVPSSEVRLPVDADAPPRSEREGSVARLERAIRLTEERYRAVFDQAFEGIFLIAGDFTVIDANESACRMLGYTHDELLALRATDLLHPEDLASVPIRFKTIAPGGVILSERRLLRKDGSVMPGELSTKALLDGTFQVVVRDVTERKSAQAQVLLADRMSSLGQLASGVAHEINNPLAYVMLNLEFLARHLTEIAPVAPPATLEAMTAAVEHSREGTERMRQIVRALSDFGRGDEERVGAVDVNRVLESAVEIAAMQLRHRTRVTRRYDPVVLARANAFRLGQVFVNLLVNAADALRDGDSTNEIQLSTRVRADGSVAVEVRDNGRGIPRAVIGRIFDPFFTTKPIGKGTGLGLSVCHSIVTSFGGGILCDSEEGRGSCFTVVLDGVADVAEGETPTPPAPVTVERGRVLVVDDDVRVAHAVAAALDGHDVSIASSGSEAVDRCARESYDCILCDVMMPEVSGVDVYASLSRQGRGLEGNVVFMTGGAVTEGAESALARVGRPVLEKPIDVSALRAAVAAVVRAARDARAAVLASRATR